MTTTKPRAVRRTVPPRDRTKHEYDYVPILEGGAYEYPHRYVGQYVNWDQGEAKAIRAAKAVLEARPEVIRVHIYHTHPHNGPVRRYAGLVNREHNHMCRPI